MTLKNIGSVALAIFVGVALAIFEFHAVPPAKAAFPSQGTYGGTSAGTANAQTISLGNIASYSDLIGVPISFTAGSGLTNTGATQINVSGLGLETVDRINGGGLVALAGGEIPAGALITVTWNGSVFILDTNYAAGTPSGEVAYFDASSCPTGWAAANGTGSTVNVVGQFIRSLNTSGSGYDPDRTLASAQSNSVQSLGINVASSGSDALYAVINPVTGEAGDGAEFDEPGGSVKISGSGFFTVTGTGTETRPQNVALLACQAN